jgi:RND family efflux transporter MFP subunit
MHDAGRKLIQAAAFSSAAALFACSGSAPVKEPPSVGVTTATTATVPVTVDYVGITAALESVEIRARVEGYLLERLFRDGQEVAQNDLLFIIQPDQFRAAAEEAAGALARDEAELAYAREQVERYRPLVEQDYITRESFEEDLTQVRRLEATVAADRATLAEAELDLSYTEIRAPISGRIGRRLVDVGNLVGDGEATLLTTIVQLDPIYLYFSPTDADLPNLLSQHRRTPLAVRAILPGSGEHPHIGIVDFINNQVDRETATINMRASLPNPDKVLLPGQFAKVRLLLETIENAVLVPEQAIVEDQGGFTAYVVSDKDIVQTRTVEVGETIRGKRVITKGIAKGERVLISGLTRARTGEKVAPREVSMKDATQSPTPTPATGPAPTAMPGRTGE